MDDYLEKDPNARAAIDQLDYAHFEPTMPSWYECRQILRSYFQKVTTEFNEKMAHDDYSQYSPEVRTEVILKEYLGAANRDINAKLDLNAKN